MVGWLAVYHAIRGAWVRISGLYRVYTRLLNFSTESFNKRGRLLGGISNRACSVQPSGTSRNQTDYGKIGNG
jgi:hypothetical protein